MKLLQLTTIVRDVQTATMIAQSFTRSPVLVGPAIRQSAPARRAHRLAPSRRVLVLEGRAPVHRLQLGERQLHRRYPDRAQPADRHSRFVGRSRSRRFRSSPTSIWSTRAGCPTIRTHRRRWWRCCTHGPRCRRSVRGSTFSTTAPRFIARARLARRASSCNAPRASLEIVAERMLAAGSRTAEMPSPLRLAATVEEMVALLLDPAGGDQRFAELRELLAELLRPRLTSVP